MVAPGQMRNVILRPLVSSGTETTSASDCWSKHPRIGLCIQPLDILRPEIPFDPGGCPGPQRCLCQCRTSRVCDSAWRCMRADINTVASTMPGKVLVVDDDAVNRELLEEVLVADGLEVVTPPDD